jgi:RHS repeat-associated protein
VTDSITGIISRTYDGLNRLTSEVTPQGSVSYAYDAAGRRQGMSVSGQTAVNYTFDNANRLTQISQGSTNVSFGYDNDSRRNTLTLPNGVSMNYGYDAASQLASITYKNGSTAIGNLTYAYDLAGRRTGVGGSYARTNAPAAAPLASYNVNNQLTNWKGATLQYDANGNLTSDGTNTYTWNARNQLVTISGPASASFQYDPFGRRVSKTIVGQTQYLYDGANPVQEISGSTASANLLTGGVDEYFQRTDLAGTRNFLTDALGSTLALTDSTGTLQTQYTFEPFGNTSVTGTATTNSFAYSGRELDSTGLYFYRARYYNQSIGRFVSEDPLGFAGGINQYAYVADSPVNFSDPAGLYWPYEHRSITYNAAISVGYSVQDALALADAVAAVDDRPGTQKDDPYNSNTHAMAGRKPNGKFQNCSQAYTGTQNQIAEDEARNDLAKALHTIEDSYSPAHFGYQQWDGGWTKYHIPSASHIWGDFQSTDNNQNVVDATTATAAFINNYNDWLNWGIGKKGPNAADYLAKNPCRKP